MMVKAVIFDFDGTVNTAGAYYEAFVRAYIEVVAERLGCSPEEAESSLEGLKKETLSVTAAANRLGIPPKEFYSEIAGKMDVEHLLTEDLSVRRLIRTVKGMGVKVALLTNTGRSLLRKALDAIGCPLDEFDLVVTSEDVEPKPSLEPFKYTLKLLGVRPEEAVYVGDRVLNELKPAKEVGLWTVHVDSWGEAGEKDRVWVDWTATSIHQLPEILKDTSMRTDRNPL